LISGLGEATTLASNVQETNAFAPLRSFLDSNQSVDDARAWLKTNPGTIKLGDKQNWYRELAWTWNSIVESLVANLVWQDWYKEFLCCFVRYAMYLDGDMLSVLKKLLKWKSFIMINIVTMVGNYLIELELVV